MTPEDLIAFETDIAETFNAGKIRAPVHLYSGNETQMIEVFRNVKPADWVFCSWRSHYQCLLKGVPREKVKAEILAGRSISLCFPEHRVVSSAIVGYVAVRFFIRYVAGHSLAAFAWYRLALAAAVVVWWFGR